MAELIPESSSKNNMSTNKLPRRIKVSKVTQSRYQPGNRPVSWDNRKEGIEKVLSDCGEELTLYSNGGQSSPAAGWELLLTEEKPHEGISALTWTLYGLAKV